MTRADESAPPAIQLTWIEEGITRQRQFATQRIGIGRHPTCDLVLRDPGVSRMHVLLIPEGTGWILQDAESANGTCVNGFPGDRHVLAHGDKIILGETELVFERLATLAGGWAPEGSTAPPSSSLSIDDHDSLASELLGAGGGSALGTLMPGAEGGADVLRMVQRATADLLRETELDATLEATLALVMEHLPAERVAIATLTEDAEQALRILTERTLPGHSAGPLQISRSIARATISERTAVLVRDIETDSRFGAVMSLHACNVRSAICAPLSEQGRVLGVLYADRTSPGESFTRAHLARLTVLANLSAVAIARSRLVESLERERRIRERLARYHAHSVVDEIVGQGTLDWSDAAPVEREVTILFADLVGFTGLSEVLPAARVTGILNRLFEALSEELFTEGGTLDKFLGDGFLAFFGAPLEQSDHAVRAVRSALAMQRRLAGLPMEDGLPVPALRIGINSGMAVVGDIGTAARRDYTVIGDTVNIASRLESSVARPGQVVIGPRTFELLSGALPCRELEAVLLRGRQCSLTPYVVLDPSAR